eukprot:1026366-Alexandrium_andersonii.AAC.1
MALARIGERCGAAPAVRLSAAAPRSAASLVARYLLDGPAAPAPQWPLSVSYTHLTLPTICSV